MDMVLLSPILILLGGLVIFVPVRSSSAWVLLDYVLQTSILGPIGEKGRNPWIHSFKMLSPASATRHKSQKRERFDKFYIKNIFLSELNSDLVDLCSNVSCLQMPVLVKS